MKKVKIHFDLPDGPSYIIDVLKSRQSFEQYMDGLARANGFFITSGKAYAINRIYKVEEVTE